MRRSQKSKIFVFVLLILLGQYVVGNENRFLAIGLLLSMLSSTCVL